MTGAGGVELGTELRLAIEVADRCDAITLPAFGSDGLRVDHKADHSEVTEADRAAEEIAVEDAAKLKAFELFEEGQTILKRRQ